MSIKVGIVGVGAIGGAVAKKLTSEEGIEGFTLTCISDPNKEVDYGVNNVSLDSLIEQCDLIIECLPADAVPQLAEAVFKANKDIIFISSAALLVYPQIMDNLKQSKSRAYLPSGALCGLDGVTAMQEMGIESAKIASSKPPMGFTGAPFIVEQNIDLKQHNAKDIDIRRKRVRSIKRLSRQCECCRHPEFSGYWCRETRALKYGQILRPQATATK